MGGHTQQQMETLAPASEAESEELAWERQQAWSFTLHLGGS